MRRQTYTIFMALCSCLCLHLCLRTLSVGQAELLDDFHGHDTRRKCAPKDGLKLIIQTANPCTRPIPHVRYIDKLMRTTHTYM
jgi:hypothetical protein